jgi:hypothetical protein
MMNLFLYILALLWIVLGTFMIIYTEGTRAFLKKVFFREHIRWISPVPFVFGLILIIAAFKYPEIFWLAIILGSMGLMKGIYLFIGPSSQIKAIMEWWFSGASDRTIRMFGLITFFLGTFILSHVR